MNDQIRLLIQRQKMLVFINNVQRDILRNNLIHRLRRSNHLHQIAIARMIARLGDPAVDLHQILLDQLLHAARER